MAEDESNRGGGVSRRQFAAGLAASGVLAVQPAAVRAYPERAVIQSLRDVLNIEHLDRAARSRLAPEVYHFISGASDDGLTRNANREAFLQARVRPRRLVDVSRIDTRLELFGRRLASPVILAPAGDQMRIHAEGELATARGAAAAGGHLLIAAQMSNASVEEIVAEFEVSGGAGTDAGVTASRPWLQLYPSPNPEFTDFLAARAAAAGCGALVLTIDGPARGNHEAERWFALHRDRNQRQERNRLGNFEGFSGRSGIGAPAFTWDDVVALRKRVTLPLLLKGIVTAEDARLCRQHGVDGIIVSNHGGRQEGNGRGTFDVLPEVVAAIDGRMPVLIDGGVRRGADVFKALALGADAVCVGRPYLWGLGAFGEAGVAKSLTILQTELERTMRYAGTPTLEDIRRDYVYTP